MKKTILLSALLLAACGKTPPPLSPPPPTAMQECLEILPPVLPMTKNLLPRGAREDNGEVVDVLVLYTPKTRSVSGGETNIKNAIINSIGAANIAYGNSMVKQRIRLVYCGEINFKETGNASEDLGTFTWATTTTQLRNQYGADCCSLVEENTAGVCGTGYLLTSITSAFAPYAMNVVQRSCLSNYTLAHEFGHNMGCSHDRDNAGYGLFPYSYGGRTVDKLYRDIMSYSPGTRVNLFGGVGVSYNTKPLGNALNDCRRTLDATSKTVANFRLSVISPFPTPSPSPFPTPTPVPTMTNTPQPLPTPTPTVTPTPTPSPTSTTPNPNPDTNIIYPPPSPVIPGQMSLVRWNLPQGGNAVDIYLKSPVGVKLLAGGTRNDGSQSVLIPVSAPGKGYQIMIKQYSDLKNYYSDYFSIQ